MTSSGYRLLVCGWVERVGGEVVRGMPVRAEDGCLVGAVAAVVQSGAAKMMTHLLLGQVPPTAVYRLIPLALLDHLEDEQVWLNASCQQVDDLPLHQPDA